MKWLQVELDVFFIRSAKSAYKLFVLSTESANAIYAT